MKIIDHNAGLVRSPGLYRMPADLYHGDPCAQPSLSSSIAKLIIEKSAYHAWLAHPRLGKKPEAERDRSRVMEIGTAMHKLILGQGAEVVVIDAEDYRTKAAKAERADAYAAGHAPILRPDHDTVVGIAEAVIRNVALVPGCEGFATAPAEVVAIAREDDGTWIRIMMDRVEIHDTHAIIYDLKSGDQSAAPQALGKRIENMGMEVQSNLYVRALQRLFPHLAGRIVFRWIFVENETPDAVTVTEADAVGLHVGSRKVDAALHVWRQALGRNHWPAYPRAIVEAEYPSWGERRWTEREQTDPAFADVSYEGIGT